MADAKTVAHQSFQLIETGDPELAVQIIAADFVNDEAADDPNDVQRQLRGPDGFLATSRWLREAFTDLRFDLHETVAEGDTVVTAALMTGRHTGPFNGIAPTGRSIAHRQVHIFTVVDDHITRHRAVRDDLGLMLQLGAKLVNSARDAAATSASSQSGMRASSA